MIRPGLIFLMPPFDRQLVRVVSVDDDGFVWFQFVDDPGMYGMSGRGFALSVEEVG